MQHRIGSEEFIVVAMAVPATAMIVTDHIWLGAAIVAGAVSAGLAAARSRLRAEMASEREILSYAHTATSLGADPAPVIKAMRQAGPDEDDGPPVHLPRRY